MSNFTRINTFANKFSDNMLPVTSVFDDNTVLNVTSGSGTCNFVRDRKYGSFANMSVTSYNSTSFNFNFSDALKTVVNFDGNYFFQLSFFNINTTPEFFVPFEFYVDVYKDGVLSETIAGQMVSNPTVNSKKTITFAQNIVCNAIYELDFAFRIGEDITYPFTNITFSIGNFKLEHNNKFLSAPTPYSLPFDLLATTEQLNIVETQWDVPSVTTTTIANNSYLNLLTLINNATNKNTTNTDVYDELQIVSNSILTTYRGCKTIHTIRISFNISTGSEQFYQLQIRRTVDNSVVYRCPLLRNPDESVQTAEMTTRTLSDLDPFTIDGFYITLVNNSGASCEISGAMSLLIISKYQKVQN